MPATLRRAPAWLIVLTFAALAIAAELAAALIVRGRGDGWDLYGPMVFASLGLQIADLPAGVEAVAYLITVPAIAWLVFDRPRG